MYVGGLIARPKYLWLAALAVGVLHIAVSMPAEWSNFVNRISAGDLYELLVPPVLPGMIAIALGIILLALDRANKKKKAAAS